MVNWDNNFGLWLAFPHQLFERLPSDVVNVALVEEDLFFTQFAFHKQKLIFHRATMRYYASFLKGLGYRVGYFGSEGISLKVRDLMVDWKSKGFNELSMYRLEDDWLHREILSCAQELDMGLRFVESPQFVLDSKEIENQFLGKKQFLQANFYSSQRKKYQVLMDGAKPMGGKWSFDEENRLKYPKSQTPPALPKIADATDHTFISEAIAYVSRYFPNNPGECSGEMDYPVTHLGAKRWLQDFLTHRMRGFGSYEDALVSGAPLLHHSLLSIYLNNGFLLPDEVLTAVLKAGEEQDLALNDVEGFVRQLLGWREFIRGIYIAVGRTQRTRNYWEYNRQMPKSFYDGTTGIVPVDIVIKKVLRNGYCHHIERLMVLSNFMLLCDLAPNAVYRWFMEMFLDAYDWVMVPNVYGMGQFADGGMMSTKPYISGSNYILKMSDFEKGPWTEIWDGLYWRFIDRHRDFFLKNPRMGVMVNSYDKMDADKRNRLSVAAEQFLKQLN